MKKSAISAVLSEIGRRGGAKKSEAKTRAARENAKKPRTRKKVKK